LSGAGAAFATAISSERVLAGNDLLATSATGGVATMLIGTKSFAVS
jgi:hypothetical protein